MSVGQKSCGKHPIRFGGGAVRERLAAACRRGVEESRSPAKTLARATGFTPEAAERWLAGLNSPSALALLRICAVYDAVWDEVRAIVGREASEAERALEDIAERLGARRR